VLEGEPLAVPLELLAADPGPELQRPVLAVVEGAAVPQQELPEPVARRGEVLAHVVASPHQVAHRLLVLGGHRDGGELAGPVEPRELARIAPVGLDAVAGPDRNERRRDDLAGDAHRRELPIDLVPARPGLVAAA
jgi:hypothetical protein